MKLIITQRVRFSDIDPAGSMGIRAFATYFQDMTAAYMQDLDRGDDATLERYHTIWMFTRMRMVLARPARTAARLTMSCWGMRTRTKRIVPMAFEAADEEGPLFAGRLDACLFNLDEGRLVTLDDIELDQAFEEDRVPAVELGRFSRAAKTLDGMREVASHRVTYADLDMAGHMNNLSYLRLVLETRSAAQHATHPVREAELTFLSQCAEGDELAVYRSEDGDAARYAIAPRGADVPAFTAVLR